MRSVRSLCEWPRALSARRLVLLATVANLGVARSEERRVGKECA